MSATSMLTKHDAATMAKSMLVAILAGLKVVDRSRRTERRLREAERRLEEINDFSLIPWTVPDETVVSLRRRRQKYNGGGR